MQNTLTLNPFILSARYFVWKPNKKILLTLSFSLIFSLFIFHIYQMNNLVSRTYSLQNYQKTIQNLTQENEKLEMSLAGMGSLGSIEGKISELEFEKISQIHYIQILENSVASAR